MRRAARTGERSTLSLAALLLACGPLQAQPAASEAGDAGASALSPAERQECLARWEADEARGITHGTAVYQGALTVLIDRSTWSAMDLDARLAMIRTLECAFAGPPGTLLRADFRDLRSDEVLGEWRHGELYRPGHRRPYE